MFQNNYQKVLKAVKAKSYSLGGGGGLLGAWLLAAASCAIKDATRFSALSARTFSSLYIPMQVLDIFCQLFFLPSTALFATASCNPRSFASLSAFFVGRLRGRVRWGVF